MREDKLVKRLERLAITLRRRLEADAIRLVRD